jgi:hypothetical protein
VSNTKVLQKLRSLPSFLVKKKSERVVEKPYESLSNVTTEQKNTRILNQSSVLKLPVLPVLPILPSQFFPPNHSSESPAILPP